MSADSPRISKKPGPTPVGLLRVLPVESQPRRTLTDGLMHHLRGVQGALAPAAPGTVMRTTAGLRLRANAAPGSTAELRLRLDNRQRVHCLVSVALTPLVAADGTTWYPQTTPPFITKLIGPDEVTSLFVRILVPDDLGPGSYRGALRLQGFRGDAIRVAVAVIGESR